MVYNLRNPHPAPWRELLKIVPPEAWLDTLRASIQKLENNDDSMARNPAVKLIDFFEKLWMADAGSSGCVPQHLMRIERALKASPTLRSLVPVRLEWMQKWVQEWSALPKNSEHPHV